MPVYTAHLIGGPLLQSGVDLAVYTQRECFFVSHAYRLIPSIHAAHVDDRLRGFVGDDGHHDVVYHIYLALVVKIETAFGLQLADGHLGHTHRAVHDDLTGGQDSGGLLPLEHGGGDLRSVGQMGEPGVHDLHAGHGQTGLQLLFHLDDTTPHIHMQVVPVAEKKRRGRVKAGQERGMVKTVSYAGIVGETPEALSKYLDEMHTDYHLQVGYKYGLERGTFFDDLTPEEQALRPIGNRSKAEYIIVEKIRDEINKLQNMKEELNGKISALTDQVKLLEKKLKAITKMINNLNEQKELLEIEITALKEMRDNGNEEVEQQLKEKQKQLDGINEKIALRTGQLSETTEQLKEAQGQFSDLAVRNMELEEQICTMSADAAMSLEWKRERIQEADRAIEEKRKEVAKMDKTGELEKARRHVEERDAVLYRRWPEARNAVKSIFEFANSSSVHVFTPQQALHVEHAIVTSGTTRTKAAEELMSLAKKDFDNNKTYSGWVNGAMREVMKIASNTHHRLNALLRVQPRNAGGGPSYITDLTDWAGNQVKW